MPDLRPHVVPQELFLDDIIKRSHAFTVAKKRKTMQLQDIGG
jgi:histone H3/H4